MAESKFRVPIPIDKADKLRILVHEDITATISGTSQTIPVTGIEITYYGERKVIFGTVLGGDSAFLGKALFFRNLGTAYIGYSLT